MVTADPLGFLEHKIDAPSVSGENNRFVLSLIPYEETTTYKEGTRLGPEAIVDASGHIELLDETLRIDASSFGVETLRPRITDLGSISQHAARVAKDRPDALLGFFGGEHSITPAIIEGLGLHDVGIVWIDAHADLRESFHGRKDNHACAGYNSVPFGHIVQVGIRSLAAKEVLFLDSTDRVRSYRDWEPQVKDAISNLPQTVYLSIDLDGFTPELMRAVGTPEPGGLTWQEVMEILDFVFRERDVRAFDVVELLPDDRDVVSSYTAARLVYKVMAYHAYYKLSAR